MSIIVAIDGGQSQSRIAVQADGKPNASHTAAGLYYGGDGDGLRTIARMLDGVGAVLTQHPPLPRIDTFVLALSGMPSGRRQRALVAAEVTARFGPRRQLITSDLPAAYAGAIGLGPGAVLSVGSGTIALGADGHGQVHTTGGGGALLGDDGSAYWIGLRGLRQAWRAHTGRAGSADLLQRAARQYGPVNGLPSRLRGSQNPVSEVAGFAPGVVDAARAGDGAAVRILREAADHLADMLGCVVTATFPAPEHKCQVSWSGRLLRLSALHELFAAAVRKRLPSVDLRPPDGTALDGAFRLAAAADLGMFGDHISVMQDLPTQHDVEETPVSQGRLAPTIGGLIVSCQALPGSPLYGPAMMSAMAQAAVRGGARGIRANGPDDIRVIRAAVDVPIIGINKTSHRGPDQVYITPTVEAAADVARAGADIIAIDGTSRPRPGGGSLSDLISRIHEDWGLPVMADIDTIHAGIGAREAGADLVATTLSGYTAQTADARRDGPDLALVGELAAKLDCLVIAEGRYTTPDQMKAALSMGAAAVVIGTAITNPQAITRTFTEALS